MANVWAILKIVSFLVKIDCGLLFEKIGLRFEKMGHFLFHHLVTLELGKEVAAIKKSYFQTGPIILAKFC